MTDDLMSRVRATAGTTHVLLTGHDGYTTNLTLGDFSSRQALSAHSWKGEALTPEHRGPTRLIVPHLYFGKSAKWLRRIEFVAPDRKRFRQVLGSHNQSDPW